MTTVAEALEHLAPVARQLRVDGIAQFQSAFDRLRVSALGALETDNDYFGQAQQLDTPHELENLMRQRQELLLVR